MRRVLALALVGGAAYAAWRLARSGGLGGAPGAGAGLDAIEAYAPGELRSELDEERARDAADAWRADRTTDSYGAALLAQIPRSDLARQVEQLAAGGRAAIDEGAGNVQGIRATSATTADDRRVLAEAECRRAAALDLIPVWQVDDCTRGLARDMFWTYAAPGSRSQVRLYLGTGGLPGFELPPPAVGATVDPVTGLPARPRTR